MARRVAALRPSGPQPATLLAPLRRPLGPVLAIAGAVAIISSRAVIAGTIRDTHQTRIHRKKPCNKMWPLRNSARATL
jgi:hypothetical protein